MEYGIPANVIEFTPELVEIYRKQGYPITDRLIESASKYNILYFVILPLIKPGLGAVAVLSFSATWADFLMPHILLNSDTKYTISVGIFTAF